VTQRGWHSLTTGRHPALRHLSGLDLVVQRATSDRDFRRSLLRDPRQAIAHAFDLELPAQFRLKFVEKDPDIDLMVVLPDLVQADGPASDVGEPDGGLGGVTGGAIMDIMEWLDDALTSTMDETK
jgi:hypothetical protein